MSDWRVTSPFSISEQTANVTKWEAMPSYHSGGKGLSMQPNLQAFLAFPKKSDYYGHMIKTLKESKATLSALVAAAAAGEEVLITVRGRAKARLVGVSMMDEGAGIRGWQAELKSLQARYSVTRKSAVPVLDALREDRW